MYNCQELGNGLECSGTTLHPVVLSKQVVELPFTHQLANAEALKIGLTSGIDAGLIKLKIILV